MRPPVSTRPLVLDHKTSYPSADGIDWNLFPYEDTQGPMLSPEGSRRAGKIEKHPPQNSSTSVRGNEVLIGDEGFHIDRWMAGVPGSVPEVVLDGPQPPSSSRPRSFLDASVQVSPPSPPQHHRHPPVPGPSFITARPEVITPDIVMVDGSHSRNGTVVSSTGLSELSSGGNHDSDSDMEEGSEVQRSSDMDLGSESEDENEEAIAASYTGD